MGVVYKAEDTKLKRQVALKFLPSHLLGDADVRARFEREAQAAAALHHPNICPVYEIDEVDEKSFIAMAFIEGESLDKKIAQGPLKLDEALSIARQIAEGLEAAHEKGIHHRDIKPENVIVDAKGRVTLMDFGLAQLTEASRLTRKDETVGTVFYMSPEQTEGSGTDNRTDVWALGVVLYEMVTGQRPFKGDYDKAVMYSILNEAPEPITALRTGVPMLLEEYVGKAIAKQPSERYQTAADFAVDLATLQKRLESGRSGVLAAQQSVSAQAVIVEGEGWKLRAPWILAAGATLAFLAVLVMFLNQPNAERKVRRFSFAADLLSSRDPAGNTSWRAAVSPDSRWIVYVSEDPPALWLRAMDQEEPRKLEGTEGSFSAPFWSPDSRLVGFADRRQVKTISVDGGPPTVLCDLPAVRWKGGSWSADGESVIFSSGSGPPALYEVSALGGEPRLLFERGAGEVGPINVEPYFLPTQDAVRALLFAVGVASAKEVYVRNLETGETDKLAEGGRPIYSPTGHVIYEAGPTSRQLWALPFSLDRLEATGEAFPIAENIAEASLAADGTLVGVAVAESPPSQLGWRDRAGTKLGTFGRPLDRMLSPEISPDGKWVSVSGGEFREEPQVWIHQVGRAVSRRLTSLPDRNSFPTWAPSGRELAFVSTRQGNGDLFKLNVDDAADPEPLVRSPEPEFASDWSPDGRFLVYGLAREETSLDLFLLDVEAGETRPFLTQDTNESFPRISPDARYVAYTSNESGSYEIHVRAFPSGTEQRQVSEGGGMWPRWSPRGDELFYVEGQTLVAVQVDTGSSFQFEVRGPLFDHPGLPEYGVASDGRFVLVEPVDSGDESRAQPAIRVVQNWYEEFRDREQPLAR